MLSIRTLYNYTQDRRRFRPRSRPALPSPSPNPHPSTMSTTSPADCRACQLGLFCYDHLDTPRTPTTTPQRLADPEPKQASPTAKTAQPNKEPPPPPPPPASTGTFEKSQSHEQTDSIKPTPKGHSQQQQQERDPKLPRIQVNGVEIPYWVTSR